MTRRILDRVGKHESRRLSSRLSDVLGIMWSGGGRASRSGTAFLAVIAAAVTRNAEIRESTANPRRRRTRPRGK